MTELPSNCDFHTDSGADAATFPASFGLSCSKVADETVVLHDAGELRTCDMRLIHPGITASGGAFATSLHQRCQS